MYDIDFIDNKLVGTLDVYNAICVDFNTKIISVLHEVFDIEIGIDVVETIDSFDNLNLNQKIKAFAQYLSDDFPLADFIEKANYYNCNTLV